MNGLEAYTGIAEIKTNLVRVTVIYFRDQAFIFFGGVKDNKLFKKFDAAFLATAKSFHRLRDNEIDLAQALKIKVVKVTKHDNYRLWATKSRITNSPLMQLRLLNGHYPATELRIGQQAKRVE